LNLTKGRAIATTARTRPPPWSPKASWQQRTRPPKSAFEEPRNTQKSGHFNFAESGHFNFAFAGWAPRAHADTIVGKAQAQVPTRGPSNTSGTAPNSHWNQSLDPITNGYLAIPRDHATIPVKYLLTT
jgi:hypothetical protein